jgi:hypothetical protein
MIFLIVGVTGYAQSDKLNIRVVVSFWDEKDTEQMYRLLLWELHNVQDIVLVGDHEEHDLILLVEGVPTTYPDGSIFGYGVTYYIYNVINTTKLIGLLELYGGTLNASQREAVNTLYTAFPSIWSYECSSTLAMGEDGFRWAAETIVDFIDANGIERWRSMLQ